MSTTYALRIREIRQKHNLTQTQFAFKIGTTKNQLSKYETGLQEVPTKIIIAVCNTFNVSADWLLGIDRGEETKVDVAKSTQMRNAVNRAGKALQKEGITASEKQAIIDQLQALIDRLQ